MLSLKLTPGEFEMMIDFLRCIMQNQRHIALSGQPLPMLVLMEYMNRWHQHRIEAWQRKKWNREHTLSMATSVAVAMHREMQQHPLTPLQQDVLSKLDRAIVNYNSPHTQYHLGNLTIAVAVR